MGRRRYHDRGVSLAELLIIMLVVACAIVPIYTLMTENARQVSFNADHAVAQILASQVFERYRYERYEDMVAQFPTPEAGKNTRSEERR